MELKQEHLWPLVHARLRAYRAATWNIDQVAAATGSTPEPFTGWLASMEPTGERLIKLWHFLAASGCESPELNQLRPINRVCGQLLTFGLVDMAFLQSSIDVTQPQPVLRMLRGSEPFRWHVTEQELRELYGPELKDALQGVSITGNSVITESTSVASSPLAFDLRSDPVVLTATLLGAVSPLVADLVSDSTSPEERSRRRDLLGNEQMFKLSTTFNRLCSERARDHGRQ